MIPLKGLKVCVVGHRGMVGSAIMRALAARDCQVQGFGREQADLREQQAVRDWFVSNRPDVVFLAAAKVGGIAANDRQPASFLYDNLMIEANVIDAAYRAGVRKLLVLGSSCIYPKFAPQPITESALLTGPLEPTNQWYAIAKIAGLKLAQAYRLEYGANFISGMPTNLYGPGDNFDLETGHVMPALIHKMVEAKLNDRPEITIWGSGTPLREFLHVDDCADACIFLMEHYADIEHVNIGSGSEISISDLARMIAGAVGYRGSIRYDRRQPDGTPRKLMNGDKLHRMGWRPKISLEDGIRAVAARFEEQLAAGTSAAAILTAPKGADSMIRSGGAT